jgi:hypothetical protein
MKRYPLDPGEMIGNVSKHRCKISATEREGAFWRLQRYEKICLRPVVKPSR